MILKSYLLPLYSFGNWTKNLGSNRFTNRSQSLYACIYLEKRYLRGDLIETFKIIKNIDKVDRNIFVELANPDRSTRGHSLKIQKHFSRTYVRKSFFSNYVNSSWNSLPNSVVECKALDSFKHHLDVYFGNINILRNFL